MAGAGAVCMCVCEWVKFYRQIEGKKEGRRDHREEMDQTPPINASWLHRRGHCRTSPGSSSPCGRKKRANSARGRFQRARQV